MTKSNKKLIITALTILVLVLIGLFNVFGIFGFTIIGIQVFDFFKYFLGSYALIGTFICFGAAYILWLNLKKRGSKRDNKRRYSRTNVTSTSKDKKRINKPQPPLHRNRNRTHTPSQGVDTIQGEMEIPGGKLVSLRGFTQYFKAKEWPDSNTPNVDYSDLGEDFSTYFGEGSEPPPSLRNNKVVSINGFQRYFNQANQETAAETEEKPLRNDQNSPLQNISENKKPILPEYQFPGQVANLISGVTSQEREILLGKPRRNSIRTYRTVHASFSTKGKEPSESETDAEEPDMDTASDMKPQLPSIAKASAAVSHPKPLWFLPDITLLEPAQKIQEFEDTNQTANRLEEVLQEFGISAKVIRTTSGPVITRFELTPAPGVKISKIVNLADDIALALAARDVRIEAPIPGKAAIGVEIPNQYMRSVTFREVLETPAYTQYKSKLKTALGKDIANQTVIADLAKMPHLLIAGATGSGKSVCITSLINSLLMNAKPSEVRLMLIDPKMVELNQYNGIPHLLSPVVNDPKKAAAALKWIVKEMETRYELFAASNVRDIERYNQAQAEQRKDRAAMMPWIVVVIDELADLMLVAAGEVEESICRLAQMARAAGIHLVIATQRPSVDVITGVIKANIPSRISFAVSSQIDSRTILDAAGAEKLLGKGDMLYLPQGQNKSIRVQGCLLTDAEVGRIIEHWKNQGKPDYLNPEQLFETTFVNETQNFEDDLFYQAGDLMISTGMASVTFLQRRLKVGYARAARLMDMLEENGVVGGYEGSKPRQILLTQEEFKERFMAD